MPKELTHWSLAERVYELLPHGPIRRDIEAHRPLYYLGAVVYDSAYYAVALRRGATLLKASDSLHGLSGGNPFAPLQRLLTFYLKTSTTGVLAFLAGAVTHIFGDVSLHPLVHYFSGPLDEGTPAVRRRALARHRWLETCMDCFLLSRAETRLENDGRLPKTLQSLEQDRPLVEKLVRTLYWGERQAGDVNIWSLLRRHALIQGSFDKRLVRIAGRLLKYMSGGLLDLVASLYYPRHPWRGSSFFADEICYRNPWSGEMSTESVFSIFDHAALAATLLLGQCQSLLALSGEVAEEASAFFEERPRVSLESGCDPGTYPQARFFDTSAPIETFCRGE